MVIAYASQTDINAGNLGTTTPTVNKPSGTVDGDLLLALIVCTATGVTVTPPSGGAAWNTSVSASGVHAFWKVAASEPASYAFTRSANTNSIQITVARITGAATGSPIDAFSASPLTAASTTAVIPSLTVVNGVYLFELASTVINATWTPPGTTTEDFDHTSSGSAWGVAGGHETVTAGATGTRTWTASASANRAAAMWSIATTAAQTVSPGGVDSSATVGSPTLVPGAVTISPSGTDSSAAVGSPTLAAGAVTVSPSGVSSPAAVGSPTLLAGVSVISPNGIAPTTVVGSPMLTAGSVTISPNGIAPTTVVGSPTISVVAPAFTPEWGVALNGVYLSGCDGSQWVSANVVCPDLGTPFPMGTLSSPPDGLGLPPLRTEDVSYVQRDGVRHFSDWYGPRIITLEDVTVCPDGCPECPSAREKVRAILQAWNRQCGDTELVIYTDCNGEGTEMCAHGFGEGEFGECAFGGEHPEGMSVADRSLVGPFGVVGRPRVAEVAWARGSSHCATLLLRFDGVDHRMYVLDECGTPGSGGECITLQPDTLQKTRCYNEGDGDHRCYDRCYPNETGEAANIGYAANVGTLCSPFTITLHGTLTTPFIENLSTGERIDYGATIRAIDPPVIIDTNSGTATQGGASVTHLLSGDIRMMAQPGQNLMRLGSFNPTDSGNAEVCWRPAVEMA